jgi:hypothetical protein
MDGPSFSRPDCDGAFDSVRDTNFIIENNRIIGLQNSGDDGISIKASGNTVRNNYIQDIFTNGIDVRWGHRNRIYNNWIQEARFTSIRFNGSDNVAVWNYASYPNSRPAFILRSETCNDDGDPSNPGDADIGAFSNNVECNYFDGYTNWMFLSTTPVAGFSSLPQNNLIRNNFYRNTGVNASNFVSDEPTLTYNDIITSNTVADNVEFVADQATVNEYKNVITIGSVTYFRPSFFDSLIQEV